MSDQSRELNNRKGMRRMCAIHLLFLMHSFLRLGSMRKSSAGGKQWTRGREREGMPNIILRRYNPWGAEEGIHYAPPPVWKVPFRWRCRCRCGERERRIITGVKWTDAKRGLFCLLFVAGGFVSNS